MQNIHMKARVSVEILQKYSGVGRRESVNSWGKTVVGTVIRYRVQAFGRPTPPWDPHPQTLVSRLQGLLMTIYSSS